MRKERTAVITDCEKTERRQSYTTRPSLCQIPAHVCSGGTGRPSNVVLLFNSGSAGNLGAEAVASLERRELFPSDSSDPDFAVADFGLAGESDCPGSALAVETSCSDPAAFRDDDGDGSVR